MIPIIVEFARFAPTVFYFGFYVSGETDSNGKYNDVNRTVFISWFEGSEVFRSGVCYRRGRGRIFAFRPGHKEYPSFFQDEVRGVLYNAVTWAAPNEGIEANWTEVKSIEPIDK